MDLAEWNNMRTVTGGEEIVGVVLPCMAYLHYIKLKPKNPTEKTPRISRGFSVSKKPTLNWKLNLCGSNWIKPLQMKHEMQFLLHLLHGGVALAFTILPHCTTKNTWLEFEKS